MHRGILRALFDRSPWLRGAEPPAYGKYNWIEKFEYLAIVWGNFVMILTGLSLWFFEAAFALFPKPAIDIIKLVHGFEALLAFLAIIIWHMYHVHLKSLNTSMFTGKMSREHMLEEHPLEYARIIAEEGDVEVAPFTVVK